MSAWNPQWDYDKDQRNCDEADLRRKDESDPAYLPTYGELIFAHLAPRLRFIGQSDLEASVEREQSNGNS